MDTGLVTIDGSQYFFDEKGVMITDDFDANGKHYSFSADGKCTITDANSGSNDADDSSNTNKDGLSDEFLFFTIYESGRSDDFYQGYNQTGGDHGNACGKYQFDYRYSLLPFVKYCYQKDPVFFREFKILCKSFPSPEEQASGQYRFLPRMEYDLQQKQSKICQLSGSVREAGIL